MQKKISRSHLRYPKENTSKFRAGQETMMVTARFLSQLRIDSKKKEKEEKWRL